MSYKSTHTGAQIDAGVSAALNPDATPTLSSTKLVTSGGVAAKLSEKQDTLVFDNAPQSGSNNPVKSSGIYNALALKANAANLAPSFDSTATYAIGDLVLYSGNVYRFTSAHTGAWDAGDVEQTTLGEEVEVLDAAKANKTDVATADAALTQMILASFPTDSITDAAIASFTDGADNIPVKTLTVKITPAQAAGTPTPESPLPISGWTAANVRRSAINIWDEKTKAGYYGVGSGSYNTANDQICSDYIPVAPSTQYRFAGGDAGSYICTYDKNKTKVRTISNHTFTTRASEAYITISFTSGYGTTYKHDSSINYPASDTGYHAYAGTVYPVSWETVAGTVYAGTLTWLGGDQWKLTVTMVGIDLGTLTWTRYLETTVFISNAISGIKIPASSAVPVNALCDKLEVRAGSAGLAGSYCCNVDANGAIWARLTSEYTTSTAFTEGVAGTTFVYELAAPVEYTITASDSEIKTLLGANNIFADCGDIASLTYRADVGLYIDKKLTEA